MQATPQLPNRAFAAEEVQRLSLPSLNSNVVEHQMYMYGEARCSNRMALLVTVGRR